MEKTTLIKASGIAIEYGMHLVFFLKVVMYYCYWKVAVV